MAQFVDVNCDLGVFDTAGRFELDDALVQFISSCNIACGGHVGDEQTMQQSVRLAKQNHLAIGAQLAYPDRQHFGLRPMKMRQSLLHAELKQQIIKLVEVADKQAVSLHHVKLFGALYSKALDDLALALLVVETMINVDEELILYAMPDSELQAAAKYYGLRFVAEGYANRRYRDSGKLLPIKVKKAVISNPQQALEQALQLLNEQPIETIDGSLIGFDCECLCVDVHAAGASSMARFLAEQLHQRGVELRACY